MNKLYNKLLNNSIFFLSGNFVDKLTQYILIFFVTKKLLPSEFGISDIILQTVFLLLPIVSLDMSYALFRFTLDKKEDRAEIFTNASITVLFSIIFFFITILFLSFFQEYKFYIYLLIIVNILFNIAKEFVRAIDQLKTYVLSSVVCSISQLLSCYLFLFLYDFKIIGFIVCYIVSYLVSFIYLFISEKLHIYFKIKLYSFTTIKRLCQFSIPLIPNNMMWWIVAVSDRFFLYRIIGETETGLYAISAKIPGIITIITSFFFQAWQISAIDSYNENTIQEREVYYSSIFKAIFVFSSFIVIILLMVLKPLVSILVSEDYHIAWVYAPLLLVSTLFSQLQAFLGTNYTVAKDSIGALKSTILMGVMNILLNYILITIYGIQGAAIATLASFIFVFIYRFFDTKKYSKIVLDLKTMLIHFMLIIITTITAFTQPTHFLYINIFIIIYLIYYNFNYFKIIGSKLIYIKLRERI